MHDLAGVGKWLLAVGGSLVVLGLVLLLLSRVPWLGKLPGDIRLQRERFS